MIERLSNEQPDDKTMGKFLVTQVSPTTFIFRNSNKEDKSDHIYPLFPLTPTLAHVLPWYPLFQLVVRKNLSLLENKNDQRIT